MEQTTCFEEYAVPFSYGYDRLRFVKPVFTGDTVHSRVTIAGKEGDPKRPAKGRVAERTEVIKQHVMLVTDHIHIVELKNKPA